MRLKVWGYIAITVLLIGLMLFPLIRASLYRPLPDSFLVEQAKIRELRDDIAYEIMMVKRNSKMVTPDNLEAIQRDYARVAAAQNSLLSTLEAAIRSNQTISEKQISDMTAQVNIKASNLLRTPAWREVMRTEQPPPPMMIRHSWIAIVETLVTIVIEAVQKVIETWERGWTRMDELNERAIEEIKLMRWAAWKEV